jgi:hypothetical protein
MVKTKRERWGKKFKDERNWKIYHEELITRGEFFIDLNFLENWDNELKKMNKRKIGKPFEYPNSLFVWISPIYTFLDSRKVEGFLRKLSTYIPKLKACDHSTVVERLNKLEQSVYVDKKKSYRVAVDATGNKLSNRGEYIRHKWKVQRGWIKVSIIIDRFTKELLDIELALEECTDEELAKRHLANLQDVKIEDFAGDGAYYRQELYEILHRKGILPVMKMPKNASNKGIDSMHKAVREMEKMGGYKPWRDKFKYGHRWNIEGYFSSVKRMFGECVRSHKQKQCLDESRRKFLDYERMKMYAHKRVNSFISV